MAAAEVENRCTAVLRASGLVMIAVGSRMCQVSFGDEMNGALYDLCSARHHGQDQQQGTDLGATNSHPAKYTLGRRPTVAASVRPRCGQRLPTVYDSASRR